MITPHSMTSASLSQPMQSHFLNHSRQGHQCKLQPRRYGTLCPHHPGHCLFRATAASLLHQANILNAFRLSSDVDGAALTTDTVTALSTLAMCRLSPHFSASRRLHEKSFYQNPVSELLLLWRGSTAWGLRSTVIWTFD